MKKPTLQECPRELLEKTMEDFKAILKEKGEPNADEEYSPQGAWTAKIIFEIEGELKRRDENALKSIVN